MDVDSYFINEICTKLSNLERNLYTSTKSTLYLVLFPYIKSDCIYVQSIAQLLKKLIGIKLSLLHKKKSNILSSTEHSKRFLSKQNKNYLENQLYLFCAEQEKCLYSAAALTWIRSRIIFFKVIPFYYICRLDSFIFY